MNALRDLQYRERNQGFIKWGQVTSSPGPHPAFHRLQYCKRWKAGWGAGDEARGQDDACSTPCRGMSPLLQLHFQIRLINDILNEGSGDSPDTSFSVSSVLVLSTCVSSSANMYLAKMIDYLARQACYNYIWPENVEH